jgi:hypothetical protein
VSFPGHPAELFGAGEGNRIRSTHFSDFRQNCPKTAVLLTILNLPIFGQHELKRTNPKKSCQHLSATTEKLAGVAEDGNMIAGRRTFCYDALMRIRAQKMHLGKTGEFLVSGQMRILATGAQA